MTASASASAASTSDTVAPLSTSLVSNDSALYGGIDPDLAYLDPSLRQQATSATPAFQARFNSRTGRFQGDPSMNPDRVSEFKRGERQQEAFYDTGSSLSLVFPSIFSFLINDVMNLIDSRLAGKSRRERIAEEWNDRRRQSEASFSERSGMSIDPLAPSIPASDDSHVHFHAIQEQFKANKIAKKKRKLTEWLKD